ncbi:2-oxo acid dehydrogenase subunit E2 [Rhodobacteraceae bacterium 2376]|uniref:Dihydrolipoamide acetyltransferase component of pyruvate dehydrogenase complex n=1 Tax=Rhabdonatronobacter sediminivivens TaxID=2743469 RepID=A0A7Z0HZL0_9RHOB|nr:dihydrolipoamide acetyltransferase family protein [Rhabdonatronobacter sediminivivens]NYS24779.1 2-oxo acid dehydrogenase subunit E2 [Rhabdonatronobacter sediminivivens]
MSIFTMPSLGADMESGKLAEWLVGPGDRLARGDIVAVVETQKGAIEIEIFESGEVVELIAAPGQTLPVGAPLARIRKPGEVEDETPEAAPEPEPAAPVTPPTPESAPSAPRPPSHGASGAPPGARAPGRVPSGALASPAAKARAAEVGLDLSDVPGSGPGGAVLLADVEAHAKASGKPAAKGKPGLDMAEMRRAIAAAMSRAKREIPHYYLSHRIDLQAAQDWLAATNAERSPDRRLLMGALLIRATVRALAKVPELNGRFEGGDYAPSDTINCGMAVAMRGGGLIAPAIMDAREKSLDDIMAAMRDLVARTRTGRLRNSEITQGTVTISSLGENGVDALFGVIYPPQVALVGFGSPRPAPVVHDGSVAARVCVTATLAADHRVSDGRRGATFLAEIDRLLQEPDTL